MLKEGFEYCKGIVEKGYKLCVQPARVSQYSDEEFIDMIKMFNQLNPMAIYVVDSWGTMYKDELLYYLKLADENLKDGVSVGYHGHNNMMQAFDVAQAFCMYKFKKIKQKKDRQKTTRDLIIDASVYGIGRGAGNLNTEIFAKWANERLGKNYDMTPLIRIYDDYIKDIYQKEKWGYSIPYLITAKYNANPNFASFLVQRGLTGTQIEKVISSIEPQERIIFEPKKAEQALPFAQLDENKIMNGRLGIIVPTANKPKQIDNYIRNVMKGIKKFDIDLIIYDSSKDDSVKRVVEKYRKEGVTNLIYDFYDGPIDKLSIDCKVLSAYAKYAPRYEYILGCRDGLFLCLNDLMPQLQAILFNKYDLIVMRPLFMDVHHYGNKIYTNCCELFREQCQQMTILGCSIFKSSVLLRALKEIPLDKEKNFGNWQAFAFFEYFANHQFKAASYVGNIWTDYKHSEGSFWYKYTPYIMGYRWVSSIKALPKVYDPYKAEVMKFERCDISKPFFTLRFLLNVKKIWGLYPWTIYKYHKYISLVSDTPLWEIYAISVLPRHISRMLFRKTKFWTHKNVYDFQKIA